MKNTIKQIMALTLGVLALTFNLKAAAPEMGILWQWDSTAGGDWDNANWSYGGQTGLAYKSISTGLSAAFTGSVYQSDGVWYLQTDDPSVQVGQIIYSASNPGDSFFFGRSTISGSTATAGLYTLNRANGGADGRELTDLKTRSGVNATFNSVSGTVTVDGVKSMNALYLTGVGNNLVITSTGAGSVSGTLWLNNDHDGREGKIHMDGGGYVELNNLYITNLEPGAPSDNKVRMKISNQSTGTLAFNNVTFMGGHSVVLDNENITRVTTFTNVTFAAPSGDWMNVGRGTYYFYGDNVKTNGGDLQIGETGGANIIIAAGGAFRQQGDAPINLGRNGSTVDVEVKGLLEAAGVGGATNGNHNLNIGVSSGEVYVGVSGTGQTHSHRIWVATSTGKSSLIISGTGAAIAEDQLFMGEGTGAAIVYVSDSGTLTTKASAEIGSVAASDAWLGISGHGQVKVNTAGYTTNLGISGTGVVDIDEFGYWWSRELKLGINASGRGEFNITNSGSADVTGPLRVGLNGAGIVSVSGTAWVNSTGNLMIGESAGSKGRVTVSDHGTLLAEDIKVGTGGAAELTVSDQSYVFSNGGRFLYINQANNVDGSSGIVTVSGGTLSTQGIDFGSNNASVGTGTAIFNLTGGKLIFRSYYGFHTGDYSNWGQADYTHTASDTQINLGGGVIESWENWESGMRMNLSGINGNVKFASSDTNNNLRTVTLKGALSGAGGLEVEKGTLIISGSGGTPTVHTYTGQTVIDSGATLQLTNLAELTISLQTLEDNGWSAFAGQGTLTLNGKLNLTGFDTVSGDSWRLFDTDLLAGLNISDKTGFLKGFTWDGSNTWVYDNDNLFKFDLLSGLLTIPEPSTWALMLIGALGLLGFAQRTRRGRQDRKIDLN